MAKFQMKEKIGQTAETARLGAGTALNQRFNDKDANKLVKLVGDSRYDIAATGDDIEARCLSVEVAPLDGYSVGSIAKGARFQVILDGAQADGTGLIAIGDYVVAGPQAALGVAQDAPKVRKATTQANVKASPYPWRLVAILTGNGSAGSVGIIERANAIIV